MKGIKGWPLAQKDVTWASARPFILPQQLNFHITFVSAVQPTKSWELGAALDGIWGFFHHLETLYALKESPQLFLSFSLLKRIPNLTPFLLKYFTTFLSQIFKYSCHEGSLVWRSMVVGFFSAFCHPRIGFWSGSFPIIHSHFLHKMCPSSLQWDRFLTAL